MILFLASYLDRNRKNLNSLKDLFKSLLFIFPPFILIILQNDLGTALVLMFIFVVMYYAAGGKLKHILLVFGGGIFNSCF